MPSKIGFLSSACTETIKHRFRDIPGYQSRTDSIPAATKKSAQSKGKVLEVLVCRGVKRGVKTTQQNRIFPVRLGRILDVLVEKTHESSIDWGEIY